MDLCIRNGTLVTANGLTRADLGVRGGRIAQVGGDLGRGRREIDATGLYVMPGAIDVHTHMDMPFMGTATADDFESGTRAAAAGGVTTILDFAIQAPGATLRETAETWEGKAAGKALIDYGFHLAPTRWDDGSAAEVAELIAEGFTSFKAFMAYKGALMLDDGGLFELLQATAANGGLVMVHAENGDVVASLQRQALARGERAAKHHALTRPQRAEAEATARAIALAEAAGGQLYVVHVSCSEAVEEIERARSRGLPVFAESCPQYLGVISVEDYERPEEEARGFVCSPPLRDRREAESIWAALRSHALQIVSSDHCPFTSDQKRAGAQDFTLIPNGVPGVETLVPLVWSLGVGGGHISPARFVELIATEPARRFGLVNKGSLDVGKDADIMLFDPAKSVELDAASLHQNVDYTPYQGFECRGYPVMTIARGEMVWDGQEFVGEPGRGRRAERSTHVK